MKTSFMSRLTTASRRIFMIASLALLLTACAGPLAPGGQAAQSSWFSATATPYLTPTPRPELPLPSAFSQAPGLDGLTQAGSLPPVAQRLPDHPKVVRAVDQVGAYGGTWRMVIQPAADGAQFIRTVAYEPLVRWTTDWSAIEPNLVESYSFNPEMTEYTFHLRKGLRWSDGEFFSTHDIQFWYEEVLLNKDLTPVVPSWLKLHGQVAAFNFVDAETFKVRFSSTNSIFLEQLATPDALMITAFPAHYAMKFHKDFLTADELQRLIAEGNYASWADMFIKRVGVRSEDIGNFSDPSRPRLSAWLLDEPYSLKAATVKWRRNPYYWKVDPAGKQLPYIDAVLFTVVKNNDEAINRVINGEVDMQNLSEMGIDVASTFEALGSSEYRLNPLTDGSNNVMVIHLNLAHADPQMHDVFINQNFRIGLSYAINRQEIIDVIYHGKGMPWQAAPLQDSPFYDPKMATQYTEYSLEKANQYLDKAGLAKDSLGNRLRKDGLPISFSVDVLDTDPQQIAMLNMVAKYWAEVGIQMQPNPEPLPIFMASIQANLHDAAAYRGGATFLADLLINPSNYMPSSQDTFWAVPWANWYNQVPGYKDQRLDDSARTMLQTYDRIISVRDRNQQIKLMQADLVVARESYWTIGIASGQEQYGIVRKNFHNVPENMPSAWIYPDPGPANPEQFYIQ